MPPNRHGIRKGDRYTWETADGSVHHITVSSVTTKYARIQVLQPKTGSRWSKRQKIPFPAGFIKVYAAQPELCENCESEPPALGMAYCDDCMDSLANLGSAVDVVNGPEVDDEW